MRTGPRVISEQSESSSPANNPDEYSRAAGAYIAWPLAVFELVRRAPGSLWYREHMRQAAVLGVLISLGLLVVMALPLIVVSMFSGITTTATIRAYLVALGIDVLA